jgi:chromosome segregation ATPase
VILIPPSITAYAALAWVKVVAVVVVALALVGGGYHLGAKVTHADWDKERAAMAIQHAADVEAVRAKEHQIAEQAQAIIEEQAQREAETLARVAAAERNVGSLRDTIAMLNSRPAPIDPETKRIADEARQARELLGQCSKEYEVVARDADELRDQVTGLQQWVDHVRE